MLHINENTFSGGGERGGGGEGRGEAGGDVMVLVVLEDNKYNSENLTQKFTHINHAIPWHR
jgi:hypothetical protein